MAKTEISGGVECAPSSHCNEVLPKVSASFSAACLLLHIALVCAAGSGILPMVLPMLGLAVLCGGCAVGAWRRRCSDHELGLTALMAGAMISFHLLFMSSTAHQEICSSVPDGDTVAGMLDMIGLAGGGIGISTVAELLMSAGVFVAGAAGLVAMAALAQRRLQGI